MRRMLSRAVVVLGMAALAGMAAPQVTAQCAPRIGKLKPMSWQAMGGRARLLQTGFGHEDEYAEPSIVGMWHVVFTAKTMNGAAIPDTQIDDALVVWHRDKTEIMNSGRPPQDGDFCLGVWERAGERRYVLNHFAWKGNDYAPGTPPGVIGQPFGGARLQESVTVGPLGNHYEGSFREDIYDPAGNLTLSFTGMLNATRITLNTKFGDLL